MESCCPSGLEIETSRSLALCIIEEQHPAAKGSTRSPNGFAGPNPYLQGFAATGDLLAGSGAGYYGVGGSRAWWAIHSLSV
jgi:hypothetical protein